MNIMPSCADIFSLRGLSFMAFLCLIGLLMMNQTLCKDIVEERRRQNLGMPSVQDAPDGVQLYEYEAGEKAAENTLSDDKQVDAPVDLTWKEAICLN